MTQQMRDMENRKIGREEGVREVLIGLVKDKLLTVEEAAKRLDISVEEIRNMLT